MLRDIYFFITLLHSVGTEIVPRLLSNANQKQPLTPGKKGIFCENCLGKVREENIVEPSRG